MFTARYGLVPYIKQLRFVFKSLMYVVLVFIHKDTVLIPS